MITRIRLRDWTSHEDTELSLGKGANIFIGSMGSGKTSVLEALCYGLYGKVPKASRNVKLENFIRFGKSNATVEIELETNGKKLRVVRELGKKSSAWLYVDGRLVEQTPSKVSAAVERLTGISYDTYIKAVYSEQNDIDAFINLTPTQRKEALDRIMGISDLIEMATKARRVFNLLAARKKELALVLGEEKAEELKKEMVSLEEEAAKMGKDIEEARKVLDSKREEVKKARALLEAEEVKEKRWRELSGKIRLLEGELKALAEMASKEVGEGTLEKLREEISTLQEERAKVLEEESEAEKELRALISQLTKARENEKRVAKIKEELARLREKNLPHLAEIASQRLKELEKEMERLTKKAGALRGEIARLKEALKHISSAEGGRCPTCFTVLGKERIASLEEEFRKGLKEKEEELRKAEEGLTRVKEKREEVAKKAEVVSRLMEKESILSKELESIEVQDTQELQQREAGLKEKIAALRETLESVGKRLESRRRELTEVEAIIEAKKKREKLEKEVMVLTEEVERLHFDEARLREARKLVTEAIEHYKEAEGRLTTLERGLKEMLKRSSLISEKVRKLEDAEKRVSRIDQLLKAMSYIQQGLEEAQGKRRELLMASLNQAMQNLWPSIYPYDDYTTISIEAGKEDYKFWIHNEAERFPLESVASGGEKTSFAITLRVALSIILTDKLHWLILDEPTHNLDENAIYTLGEIIKSKLPSMVDQFIIVTHDNRLKNLDFGRVFVFDRGEGKTAPTEVSVIES